MLGNNQLHLSTDHHDPLLNPSVLPAPRCCRVLVRDPEWVCDKAYYPVKLAGGKWQTGKLTLKVLMVSEHGCRLRGGAVQSCRVYGVCSC